jgi:hypothetical protein
MRFTAAADDTNLEQTISRLQSTVNDCCSLRQDVLYVNRAVVAGLVVPRCDAETETLVACRRNSRNVTSSKFKNRSLDYSQVVASLLPGKAVSCLEPRGGAFVRVIRTRCTDGG